jgi:hypothetical protein
LNDFSCFWSNIWSIFQLFLFQARPVIQLPITASRTSQNNQQLSRWKFNLSKFLICRNNQAIFRQFSMEFVPFLSMISTTCPACLFANNILTKKIENKIC